MGISFVLSINSGVLKVWMDLLNCWTMVFQRHKFVFQLIYFLINLVDLQIFGAILLDALWAFHFCFVNQYFLDFLRSGTIFLADNCSSRFFFPLRLFVDICMDLGISQTFCLFVWSAIVCGVFKACMNFVCQSAM